MFRYDESSDSVRRLVRFGHTELVCGAERSAVMFGRQVRGPRFEATS